MKIMDLSISKNNQLFYKIAFIAGEDYNEEMIFLTFSQNETRVCFNVSIIDDNIHEEDEVFFINITTSDPLVILSQPLTTLAIKSDDGMAKLFKQFPEKFHSMHVLL